MRSATRNQPEYQRIRTLCAPRLALGWNVVAIVAASVPFAVMMTFAISAIAAGVDERTCVWAMRGGLLISASLATLVPIVACIAVLKPFPLRQQTSGEMPGVAAGEPAP